MALRGCCAVREKRRHLITIRAGARALMHRSGGFFFGYGGFKLIEGGRKVARKSLAVAIPALALSALPTVMSLFKTDTSIGTDHALHIGAAVVTYALLSTDGKVERAGVCTGTRTANSVIGEKSGRGES
jgi:hypothetical protein